MWQLQLQTKSHQQHVALHMDCHLRSVAIMVDVTSRQMDCTHCKLDYSRMPAVALQLEGCKES